ncbi:MAG TPA: hypothetical protein PKG90_08285 [Chitinophagaceae bacterium]|nr:hypothetical protein [Chitinophagaceae bacterium]HNU13294.1 hypothetical protein [Chitinophagaceae bacterium]
MKKTTLVITGIFLQLFVVAQTYKITWGEEIKLKKGTADLDIIAADNTGLYFTEQRRARTMFTIGAPPSSYKLYKMDKNFGEVFDKEYKKELKGLDFQGFQTLGNDLYLFTTDYEKKTRLFKVYGAKVDKNSGELMGDFGELGSYELESKRDDYDMKVSPIHNGNSFLMVSNISAKDRVSIGVCLLDKSLRKKENTVINLSFEPNLYQLQDVQYTKNNKIILLGKEFEEAQIGKKKRKRLVFKQYVLSIYNTNGEKLSDVKLDTDDRYVISGKLIEQSSGELLLAGFYSNSAKKEDLNGFFINKVDPERGELLLSSFKEINAGMLGTGYEDAADDDDEIKESKKQAKKAKEEDEEEEFPNSFIIKSVDINPVDNSVIITSEVSRYSFYSYVNSSYNASTRTWTRTTTFVHRFTNQDILVINADQNGSIKWLNALPKSQLEEVRTTSNSYGSGFSYDYDRGGYFAAAGGMPYYSSYKSLIHNNSLILLLNDHTSNNVNPEYGNKVKTVTNFRKRSNIYGVSIDLASGKMTRKIIASNNEETILMPRHAFVVKNELFIPSWRQHLMAKTELKFAKIAVK